MTKEYQPNKATLDRAYRKISDQGYSLAYLTRVTQANCRYPPVTTSRRLEEESPKTRLRGRAM